VISILLFLSGNFPSLTNEAQEQKLRDKIEKQGSSYNRLVTFFYKKEAVVGINVHKRKKSILKKKEINNGTGRNNKRVLVKRTVKS
jgi:hypothetical protein